MYLFDSSQETKLKKRVVAMWGSSFFSRASRAFSLPMVLLVLSVSVTSQALAADVVEVEVRFAQPLFAGEGEGRKELARRAHEEVTRLIA